LLKNAIIKFGPIWTDVSIGSVFKSIENRTSIDSIITTGTFIGTVYYIAEHLSNEYRIYYNLLTPQITTRLYVFWEEPNKLSAEDMLLGSALYNIFTATNYGLVTIALANEL